MAACMRIEVRLPQFICVERAQYGSVFLSPGMEAGIYRRMGRNMYRPPSVSASFEPFTVLPSAQFTMSTQETQSNMGKSEEKAHIQHIVVNILDSEPGGVAAASRAEERRLVRKLDRRIMPMLAVMYLFACESPFLFCCLHF